MFEIHLEMSIQFGSEYQTHSDFEWSTLFGNRVVWFSNGHLSDHSKSEHKVVWWNLFMFSFQMAVGLQKGCLNFKWRLDFECSDHLITEWPFVQILDVSGYWVFSFRIPFCSLVKFGIQSGWTCPVIEWSKVVRSLNGLLTEQPFNYHTTICSLIKW